MKENLYETDCIRTFTGKYFNVFNPDPDLICIDDIAHALSNIPRFGGHLPKFYSVAEHSYLCSGLAKKPFKLEALLHDASEAYLMDIPRPIKNHLPEYHKVEENLMKAISQKFGFNYPLSREVKQIDNDALEWEWERMVIEQDSHIFAVIFSPEEAKFRFIERFNEITE